MEVQDRNLLFSAMNTGKPYKSYTKTILGKVFINAWDTMTNQPTGLLLSGDPRTHDDSCIYDVWSEFEDVFFKRMNKKHFETSTIIEYTRSTDDAHEKTLEESSDPELMELINSKFLKLQHALNSTESVALLFRMKNLAIEMEKSEKLVRAIEARISEIQMGEVQTPDMPVTEL